MDKRNDDCWLMIQHSHDSSNININISINHSRGHAKRTTAFSQLVQQVTPLAKPSRPFRTAKSATLALTSFSYSIKSPSSSSFRDDTWGWDRSTMNHNEDDHNIGQEEEGEDNTSLEMHMLMTLSFRYREGCLSFESRLCQCALELEYLYRQVAGDEIGKALSL
jgi:hypothetical protein